MEIFGFGVEQIISFAGLLVVLVTWIREKNAQIEKLESALSGQRTTHLEEMKKEREYSRTLNEKMQEYAIASHTTMAELRSIVDTALARLGDS